MRVHHALTVVPTKDVAAETVHILVYGSQFYGDLSCVPQLPLIMRISCQHWGIIRARWVVVEVYLT